MIDLPAGLHGAVRRTDLVPLMRLLELPTRAAAALLPVGSRSVLTSHTAALVYGCTAADATAIHILCTAERVAAARPGLVLHIGTLDEADVLELDGLRLPGLDQVIADLLCTIHRPLALACADQALAGLDPASRDQFRGEVATRLRTRTDLRAAHGKALLELATGLPESPAESEMLLALYDAGLPSPPCSTASATSPAASATASTSPGNNPASPSNTTAATPTNTAPPGTPTSAPAAGRYSTPPA